MYNESILNNKNIINNKHKSTIENPKKYKVFILVYKIYSKKE